MSLSPFFISFARVITARAQERDLHFGLRRRPIPTSCCPHPAVLLVRCRRVAYRFSHGLPENVHEYARQVSYFRGWRDGGLVVLHVHARYTHARAFFLRTRRPCVAPCRLSLPPLPAPRRVSLARPRAGRNCDFSWAPGGPGRRNFSGFLRAAGLRERGGRKKSERRRGTSRRGSKREYASGEHIPSGGRKSRGEER